MDLPFGFHQALVYRLGIENQTRNRSIRCACVFPVKEAACFPFGVWCNVHQTGNKPISQDTKTGLAGRHKKPSASLCFSCWIFFCVLLVYRLGIQNQTIKKQEQKKKIGLRATRQSCGAKGTLEEGFELPRRCSLFRPRKIWSNIWAPERHIRYWADKNRYYT